MSQIAKSLPDLRRELHRLAESAGHEQKTSRFVRGVLEDCSPSEIIDKIAGHGMLAVFDSGKDGPGVLVRAELDALPIPENPDLDHASLHEGVSHKCGHDGHITMLLGLCRRLGVDPPRQGRVFVLFQPAEEVGAGAAAMLEDKRLTGLEPDRVFALHNLPGFPKGQVILSDGPFASASVGLVVELEGETAHAGEPEQGKSPALAVAHLIQSFSAAPQFHTNITEAAKVTVIHATVGERAFGTSPGKGAVMATLRAHRDDVMERLVNRCTEIAGHLAEAYGLRMRTHLVERFPATVNDAEATRIVAESASALSLKTHELAAPFPWSEDFGHFTNWRSGALFGLGSGDTQPALHHPDYDFPDDILDIGVHLWEEIVRRQSR